jgi:hypothetical protein
MFDTFIAWFTPPRRKAIYNVGVAVFAFLIVAGVITGDQVNQYKEAILAIAGIFGLLTNAMASKNVNL